MEWLEPKVAYCNLGLNGSSSSTGGNIHWGTHQALAAEVL